MRLHLQLLEQAEHLARRERKRPRQASLRRATSTAYYSLFHFLVDEACRLVFGRTSDRRRLRGALSRAFQHGHMKNASRAFGSGVLPDVLDWPTPVPRDLRRVANAFVTLQEERHDADYNISRSFTRAEALNQLRLVEQCLALWPAIQNDDCTRLYLVSLLAWGTLRGR